MNTCVYMCGVYVSITLGHNSFYQDHSQLYGKFIIIDNKMILSDGPNEN